MFRCNLPDVDQTIVRLASSDIASIWFENLDKNSPISTIRLCKQYLNSEKTMIIHIYYKQHIDITAFGPTHSIYTPVLKNFPNINHVELYKYFQFHVTNEKLIRDEDYEALMQTLLLFEKVDKLDLKFILFLQRVWGIRKPEQVVADEIMALAEKGEYATAIEQAKKEQANEYYEVIWELADCLHRDNLVNERLLIDLYESIQPENPHYQEANERLSILYAPDLEKQLRAAMLSQNEVRIGQIFHSLCGYKGQPIAHDLIALAAHIRMLNDQITQLKQDNARILTISNKPMGIFSAAKKDTCSKDTCSLEMSNNVHCT